MTTATVAPFGAPQSCLEAAVIPFEQMHREEQRVHLEETHGIVDEFADRFLAAKAHAEDHQLLTYQHTHKHAPEA